MKYTTITLFLFLSMCFSGFAQQNRGEHNGSGKMRKKFEAEKVSFITQQLDLTPKEAQIFWPLYNEKNQKLNEFRNKSRGFFRQLKDEKKSLTDEELMKISEQLIDYRISEANLDKEYHQKFKEILPIKKILLLYQAERKFQRMLLHKIKEKGRHMGRGERSNK